MDKEELIETILLLRERVATLEKRVAELEGKARAAVDKTTHNASVPSSRSWKGRRVKGVPAKRGPPKAGHVGKSRQASSPDEIIECRVGVCKQCAHDLSLAQQQLVGSRQVIDIPPIRPLVREARRYAVTCPC